MATLNTSDGFEFETTVDGSAIRCVCRKDAVESVALFTPGHKVAPVPIELIELVARNAWEAGRRVQAPDRAVAFDPPLKGRSRAGPH